MNKKTDKRTRLIEAADTLFHKQGVHITTLANIATLAEVPLGNVYYYFKSKDSILLAVLEQRGRQLRDQQVQWSTLGPSAALKALVESYSQETAHTAAFGHWLGALCQELCKQALPASLAADAANQVQADNAAYATQTSHAHTAMIQAATELFKEPLLWAETQFRALGQSEQASRLAQELFARLEGICLLTLVFKDETMAKAQYQTLTQWVQSLQ